MHTRLESPSLFSKDPSVFYFYLQTSCRHAPPLVFCSARSIFVTRSRSSLLRSLSSTGALRTAALRRKCRKGKDRTGSYLAGRKERIRMLRAISASATRCWRASSISRSSSQRARSACARPPSRKPAADSIWSNGRSG